MKKEIGKIIGAFLFALVVMIISIVMSNNVISVNSDKENAYHIDIAEATPPAPVVVNDVVTTEADVAVSVEPETITTLLADADIAKGKKLSRACSACHNFEKGSKSKIGPALWGVVGRDVASFEGFSYSDAMQAKGGKWGYNELDEFLTKPKVAVKGTKMSFAGIKQLEKRANLIAWLRTLNDEPLPLP